MTERLPRVTSAVRGVLAVFMADPVAEYYGYDILRAADLPSGTLYPMLARFERGGLVESRYEDPEVVVGTGRPPRRYYRLTRRGAAWADAALRPRHATRRPAVARNPRSASETGR